MKNRVGIYTVSEYDEQKLSNAIDILFQELAFESQIVPGSKVVLKPNLLAIREEKTATTTHYLFVKAVAKKVISLGATCIICDSPPGSYTKANLRKLYTKLHFDEIEKIGAILNEDVRAQMVNVKGAVLNQTEIITPILQADLVINLPKLKTHAMMNFTCGVKNLFGIIPGLHKAALHGVYPDYQAFASMLVDIAGLIPRSITIVDAILAMEGNGPNQGKPKKLGVILASSDMYALDYIAASLIGLDLPYAYTVVESINRGLLDASNIELVGAPLDSVRPDNFLLPDTIGKSLLFGKLHFTKWIKPYPVFLTSKCIHCKLCIERCPVQALTLKKGRVSINKKECIRCFCCSEHCPNDAIAIKYFLK